MGLGGGRGISSGQMRFLLFQLFRGSRARSERYPILLFNQSEHVPNLPAAKPESGGVDRESAALSRAGMDLGEDIAPGASRAEPRDVPSSDASSEHGSAC